MNNTWPHNPITINAGKWIGHHDILDAVLVEVSNIGDIGTKVHCALSLRKF